MKLEKISLSYGNKKVLENFTLEFPQIGRVCLFAPSGAGKTTILNLLCGLKTPDSGKVLGTKDKKFAMVFQEDRLIPGLTVLENIQLVLGEEEDSEAESLLAQMGLAGEEKAYPGELSGGMKRRAAIARALTFGKKHSGQAVYLLDEPLKGLDEKTAEQVRKIICRCCEGSLLVFVSHDRAQAERMADKIFFLEGEPVQVKDIWNKK